MTIQATCPQCRTTHQVADAARGKQIRCDGCKTVFVAGTTANNGNGPSPKPALSAVKPAGPAVNPAVKSRAITSNAARTKAAPPAVLEAVDEDSPPEKKKKNSMLPACLIGCGALLVLCAGGGSIGGYFAWKGILKVRDEAAEKVDRIKEEIEKAEADQKRMQEVNQKRFEDQVKQNNPEKNRLPDKNPNDGANPPAQPPQTAMVQSVARSIPLGVKPQDVFNVLWTGKDTKQGVALCKADNILRLDQYDLTDGRKLGSMDTPFDAFTYDRDFSSDGNYYASNHAGSPYSIWAMPNPKAIVEKWLPKPVQNDSSGVSATVVAAYLLEGPRVLTVNGAGQVAVWSMPTATGEKPSQQMSYVPPASEAKYPLGLGPACTALSPDRTRLAVYNGNDGFFLLNTATLQLEGSVNSPEDGKQDKAALSAVLGPVFSPDGKHLAAIFQQLSARRSKGSPPQLVRWDVQTRQRTARFADPSKGAGGAGSRIGWWGNDFFWVAYPNRSGSLISWDKQSVVLRATLRRPEKVCFGNTDGKCWFITTGPDGNAVLKGIDLPAAALMQAAQPLKLTADGIAR